MKRVLLSTGLFLALASKAFAGNGYCDSRPSNRERQNCYQNAVESNVMMIKQNYQYLMSSSKLTQQQKQQLQQDQNAWIGKVDRYCGDNLSCLYESSAERSMSLRAIAARN